MPLKPALAVLLAAASAASASTAGFEAALDEGARVILSSPAQHALRERAAERLRVRAAAAEKKGDVCAQTAALGAVRYRLTLADASGKVLLTSDFTQRDCHVVDRDHDGDPITPVARRAFRGTAESYALILRTAEGSDETGIYVIQHPHGGEAAFLNAGSLGTAKTETLLSQGVVVEKFELADYRGGYKKVAGKASLTVLK